MSTSILPSTAFPIGFLTLPRVLALDGMTCVLMGALLVTLADTLANVLALPASLLFYAGVLLFPCALAMFIAARAPRATALVWLIIFGNAAWVAASVLVIAVFEPSAVGIAFVLIQAAAVAGIGALEYLGLRGPRS